MPAPARTPAATDAALRELVGEWKDAKRRERSNYQLYLGGLCAALGVGGPRPAGSGYEYELPVKVVERDGKDRTNFVDLFKRDHFLLEAKDKEAGHSDEVMLRKAYGQARSYVTHLPGNTPPYIMVLDIARTLLVWDRWQGGFGGFGASRRIDLPTLHERPADVELLRDIWEHPAARDPRARAQAVTEEIAEKLARLAASLEARGFAQERVSRFLMRCVFTMFAEDVRLLHDEPFRRLIDDIALKDPAEFVPAIEELWRAMNDGKRFGLRKLLRFNGHFFAEAEGLPLTPEDLVILLRAAEKDWSDVEPSIFGTLLTRALDAKERHRLGAEYTPPEFIARVIRPAVEEPLRERWTAVQAEVLQLLEKGTTPRKATEARKAAEQRLREFHDWLRSLRFLDPACGSGNFLYVTMHAVKRIEVEVLNELADVTGSRELRFHEVDPSQFYGIEVKPWAREIAELTLWIGFHQFWRRTHGDVQPDEPILRDTQTLECRDAVLVWDERVEVPEKATPDRTPRLRHPVTGEMVPDPKARVPYYEYRGARPAAWPPADFIIGNPPFLGKLKQRDALGDGYVDALRRTYSDLPDAADLVMYWWHKAAIEVAEGRTIRAGLITTNSIAHTTNRAVIASAAESGARVAWAIADHYWNDGGDDARVRVAMTILARDPVEATLVEVDGEAKVIAVRRGPRLNFDLSLHADVASAIKVPLRANGGLAACGFMLAGAGFILKSEEASRLTAQDSRYTKVVRPYRKGGELTGRQGDLGVIDFGMLNEAEARTYPLAFDIIRDRVKPERDANNDRGRRTFWWRFGRTNERLRAALEGLPRYIATTETAKHRMFTFLDGAVAPDHMVICIAVDDAFVLGILSSAIHATWALAAGSRLGIDATPRYNKGACFETFPFPDPPAKLREKIGSLAEWIDAHRKAALARGDKVGMTLMYNVVDKLRAGTELTKAEREVHTLAACGTLRDLHDDLDRLVAEAYGWSWPEPAGKLLDRLVALHDQRVGEERAGTVRWLRPEYQRARFAAGRPEANSNGEDAAEGADAAPPPASPWPTKAVDQIGALQSLVAAGPITVGDATARFAGASREAVARHLAYLAILGEVRQLDGERYALS
jgi:hypothetical protein